MFKFIRCIEYSFIWETFKRPKIAPEDNLLTILDLDEKFVFVIIGAAKIISRL